MKKTDKLSFADFVKRVSFRFMGPDRYYRGFRSTNKLSSKLGFSLEELNTNLPEDYTKLRRRLHRILGIPKMSTFAIGAIINKGVTNLNNSCCFINVGVWHGFSFLAGITGNPRKRCIGIDNFSQFGGPRKEFLNRFTAQKTPSHQFFDVDYKDYFFNHHNGRKIGFYIYDGDHDYENQLEGLKIAEPFFSDGCNILVDDTNLEQARNATIDFMRSSPNSYVILLDKTTMFNEHPTFWNGIMIFQKV